MDLQRAGVTSTSASGRRAMCPLCQRPNNACICPWVTPVVHAVPVLILQHPLEVNNPKGSARLLHLSLQRSLMLTGEIFDQPETLAGADARRQDVLLYPDTPGQQTTAHVLASSLRAPPCAASSVRLVVIDGTWRKSRKMLHLNPWLQALPRLSLDNLPASRYLIRRAHQPHQLSTLEATCAALAQLEGDAQRFDPLLKAFDGFVAEQLLHSPPRACLKPIST